METTGKELKVLVLRGVPCSGKSTWAKQYVKENRNFFIVNRDSLRLMRGEYSIPEQEYLITKIENSIIKSALEYGLSVIIDSTNLHRKSIPSLRKLVEEFDNIKIEIKDFPIDLDIAIKRNQERYKNGGILINENDLIRFHKRHLRILENIK